MVRRCQLVVAEANAKVCLQRWQVFCGKFQSGYLFLW